MRMGNTQPDPMNTTYTIRPRHKSVLGPQPDGHSYLVVHVTGYIKNWPAPPTLPPACMPMDGGGSGEAGGEVGGGGGESRCCLVATGRLHTTCTSNTSDLLGPGVNTEFITRQSLAGKFSFIDPRISNVLGYQAQELLGKNVYELFHPDDHCILKEHFEQVIKVKGQPLTVQSRMHSKSGEWIVLQTNSFAFTNPYSEEIEFIVCTHILAKAAASSIQQAPTAASSIQSTSAMGTAAERAQRIAEYAASMGAAAAAAAHIPPQPDAANSLDVNTQELLAAAAAQSHGVAEQQHHHQTSPYGATAGGSCQLPLYPGDASTTTEMYSAAAAASNAAAVAAAAAAYSSGQFTNAPSPLLAGISGAATQGSPSGGGAPAPPPLWAAQSSYPQNASGAPSTSLAPPTLDHYNPISSPPGPPPSYDPNNIIYHHQAHHSHGGIENAGGPRIGGQANSCSPGVAVAVSSTAVPGAAAAAAFPHIVSINSASATASAGAGATATGSVNVSAWPPPPPQLCDGLLQQQQQRTTPSSVVCPQPLTESGAGSLFAGAPSGPPPPPSNDHLLYTPSAANSTYQ